METLGCPLSSQSRAQIFRGKSLKQQETGANERNGYPDSSWATSGRPYTPQKARKYTRSLSLREELLPLASATSTRPDKQPPQSQEPSQVLVLKSGHPSSNREWMIWAAAMQKNLHQLAMVTHKN